MLRRTFCIFLTWAALAGPVMAADTPSTLNFGIIATDSSNNLMNKWQPLVDDLSKALGMPVKPFFASDYAGVIEGMRFNKVQLAWYGNKSAIQAVDRAGGEVFANVVYSSGEPGYYALLVTNKNSKVKTLDDVFKLGPTLNYGAGDPNSTSGTAVPNYYLWGKHNVDALKFFKHAMIADHQTDLLAAINNRVDVAIANNETLRDYNQNTGKDPMDSVRILWKSPLIPSDPLVWRKDLPADLKTRIRDFFVHYGQGAGPQAERQKKALAALNYSGFHASSNAQLVPIRQIDLAHEKDVIQADKKMDDATRQQKLAAIDKRLAELSAQAGQ